MELCFVRETFDSRFFVFYTRGIGVYCAFLSHICGNSLFFLAYIRKKLYLYSRKG